MKAEYCFVHQDIYPQHLEEHWFTAGVQWTLFEWLKEWNAFADLQWPTNQPSLDPVIQLATTFAHTFMLSTGISRKSSPKLILAADIHEWYNCGIFLVYIYVWVQKGNQVNLTERFLREPILTSCDLSALYSRICQGFILVFSFLISPPSNLLFENHGVCSSPLSFLPFSYIKIPERLHTGSHTHIPLGFSVMKVAQAHQCMGSRAALSSTVHENDLEILVRWRVSFRKSESPCF